MNVLRLKEYRKDAKMSQFDIANKINITQSYYSLWETGKNLPDAAQILQLCDIFGCTPNDLFGIDGVRTVVASVLRNGNLPGGEK